MQNIGTLKILEKKMIQIIYFIRAKKKWEQVNLEIERREKREKRKVPDLI